MAKEKRQPTGDYERGYCRPPKEHQFRKGETQPYRGRRSKNPEEYARIALRVVNKQRSTIRDGKRCRMSTFEMGFESLAAKAAGGDRLAWREMINTLQCLGVKLDKPITGNWKFIIEYGPEDKPKDWQPSADDDSDD